MWITIKDQPEKNFFLLIFGYMANLEYGATAL